MKRAQSLIQRLIEKYDGVHKKVVKAFKARAKRDPSLLDDVMEDYVDRAIASCSYKDASERRQQALDLLTDPDTDLEEEEEEEPKKRTGDEIRESQRIAEEKRNNRESKMAEVRLAILEYSLWSGVKLSTATWDDLEKSFRTIDRTTKTMLRRRKFEKSLRSLRPKEAEGTDRLSEGLNNISDDVCIRLRKKMLEL